MLPTYYNRYKCFFKPLDILPNRPTLILTKTYVNFTDQIYSKISSITAGTKLKVGYGSPFNPENLPFHREKTVVKFTSAIQLTRPRNVCDVLLLKRKITVAAVAEFETRLGPDGRRGVPQ